MSQISRPSTPVDRITTVDITEPPAIDKYEPVEDDKEAATSQATLPDTSSVALSASPLDSPTDNTSSDDLSDSFNYAMYHNHPDETESLVAWYIQELESNPRFLESISPLQLKSAFVKCQSSLRHYRFQSALYKIEKKESDKRNAVETDIIKKQVDFLLQSPLSIAPSRPRDVSLDSSGVGESEMTPRTTARRSLQSPSSGGRSHTRPKLTLVEKYQYKTPTGGSASNKREYADHIKVFSLQEN